MTCPHRDSLVGPANRAGHAVRHAASTGAALQKATDGELVGRFVEASDIELLLINHGWRFPSGWDFATRYDLRD